MGSVVWFIIALIFFVLLVVLLWYRKKERFGPAPDRNVYVKSNTGAFVADGGYEFGGQEGKKVALTLKGFICYQGAFQGKEVDVYWTDVWTELYHFDRKEQEKKDELWGDKYLGNCFADPQGDYHSNIISLGIPVEKLSLYNGDDGDGDEKRKM